MKLKINPELKALIPPLSPDEYNLLEQSIINEGCRDKIITWDDVIVDGHNRYEICTKHNIPFQVEDRDFESIVDVRVWMRNNALGHRNLTPAWKIELELANKEDLKKGGEEARKKQGQIARKKQLGVLSQNDITPKNHSTRKEIAKRAGTSTGNVGMAEQLIKKAPELWEKAKTGEIGISTAYKQVRKEEKKEEKQRIRKELAEKGKNKDISIDFRLGDLANVFDDLPDHSVDCIITDPPYPYQFINCWSELSKLAKRVLKPNGFCIAYSGQMYLPEVINRMSEHLDYYWTFAVYHEGQTQIVNGINLICRWKPVLIFQNGKKKIDNTFQDYFISQKREKDGHDWQQSKSGVAYLIEMFTNPNDLILEPFAGSGTTIKVALEKNRRIIACEIDEETYNIAKANL